MSHTAPSLYPSNVLIAARPPYRSFTDTIVARQLGHRLAGGISFSNLAALASIEHERRPEVRAFSRLPVLAPPRHALRETKTARMS